MTKEALDTGDEDGKKQLEKHTTEIDVQENDGQLATRVKFEPSITCQ